MQARSRELFTVLGTIEHAENSPKMQKNRSINLTHGDSKNRGVKLL
jgi:hypothetical protein